MVSDQSYLQSKEVPSYAIHRIVRRNGGLLNPSEKINNPRGVRADPSNEAFDSPDELSYDDQFEVDAFPLETSRGFTLKTIKLSTPEE